VLTPQHTAVHGRKNADAEAERDAPPLFRPSGPARAAGPLAVPGAAELLISPLAVPWEGSRFSARCPHDTRLRPHPHMHAITRKVAVTVDWAMRYSLMLCVFRHAGPAIVPVMTNTRSLCVMVLCRHLSCDVASRTVIASHGTLWGRGIVECRYGATVRLETGWFVRDR
jgi:hypothetical protein